MKFVIYKTPASNFFWRAELADGEVLALGPIQPTEEAARTEIVRVKRAMTACKFAKVEIAS